MASIALFFSSDSEVALERVVCNHPFLAQERISVRGRSAGAYSTPNSFQWTSAVRALVLLLLRTKACALGGNASAEVPMTGGAGSAAASLDYAISKQPLWLLDMFGVDSHGHCLIRRLVRRSNPERKRGGDVALRVNEMQLSAEQIRVAVSGRELKTVEEIAALAQKIEGSQAAGSVLPEVRRTVSSRTTPCATGVAAVRKAERLALGVIAAAA